MTRHAVFHLSWHAGVDRRGAAEREFPSSDGSRTTRPARGGALVPPRTQLRPHQCTERHAHDKAARVSRSKRWLRRAHRARALENSHLRCTLNAAFACMCTTLSLALLSVHLRARVTSVRLVAG